MQCVFSVTALCSGPRCLDVNYTYMPSVMSSVSFVSFRQSSYRRVISLLIEKEAFRERILRIQHPCSEAHDTCVACDPRDYRFLSSDCGFLHYIASEYRTDDALMIEAFADFQLAFLEEQGSFG